MTPIAPGRRSRKPLARRSPTTDRPTGYSAGQVYGRFAARLAPGAWSQWGRDWSRRATAASIARRCSADARAGDIVLLHDADYYSAPGSWMRTVAALPLLLEELDARGLKPIGLRR